MKYISPGSWFSLEYPNDWREFEDEEDSFLFYNPEKWNGNFRISAYRGKSAKYAQDCMADELQQNQSARREQAGPGHVYIRQKHFRRTVPGIRRISG